MYLLLYGEDTFSIKEKVQAIEKKIQTTQDVATVRINGADLSLGSYIGSVMAGSLFESKKLVEIYNFVAGSKASELTKYIVNSLPSIPKETMVLFIEEGKPDSRNALFKALNQPKQAQYFPIPTPDKISSWIDRRMIESGLTISPTAKGKLISLTGQNYWHLDQEIQKLTLFHLARGSSAVSPESVDEMVSGQLSANVFEMVDALSSKNAKLALNIMHQLLANGENELRLLAMIVYQYRNILILADLISSGDNFNQATQKSSINPYVARKLQAIIKKYQIKEIRQIYEKLKESDSALKSSQGGALVLDLLVVDICRK